MTFLGARTTGGLVKVNLSTGGANYTSAPSVLINGETAAATHSQGVVAYACMAGTVVDEVVVISAGTGMTGATVSFGGGGGSGAAATANVYTGAMRPVSFFKGRQNEVYGVDGMGRGFRWDGTSTSVVSIGIGKPPRLAAPTMTAAATDKQYIANVQIVKSGVGYQSIPTVAVTENAVTPAKAVAILRSGQVAAVRITDPGSGYTAPPTVRFSGGIGAGATFAVTCLGRISEIRLTNPGAGYTSSGTLAATVDLTAGLQGLTSFAARPIVSEGRIIGIEVLNGGTGMTGTASAKSPPTVTIGGTSSSAASASAVVEWSVKTVGVGHSGSGFFVPPFVSLIPAAGDTRAVTGSLSSTVNVTGGVESVSVLSGGVYYDIPKAEIVDTSAQAVATLAKPLFGKYLCAIRYLDDTPESEGGPLASSISELVEIDCETGKGSLTWSLDTSPAETRAKKVELWRTTADQRVILFRVASLTHPWASTYSDAFSDELLKDPKRDGYALMPITLPSGQVNARRFEIPPTEFAVGVMFQDRAWYAVDTTGERPNTLMYSEIDEPESVPASNELILQENTGTPDKIVALIPFSTDLLIVQQSHIYKLSYVSQPAIDANVMLASYRGVLNSRCWDVLGGVAYLVDSYGMYAFDGQAEEAVSVPVDDYWRERKIDFGQSDKFHVQADIINKVVRFYYCQTGDAEPVRALCYCTATQAWWEETFPTAVTAGCRIPVGSAQTPIYARADGTFARPSGTLDGATVIPYSFRSGVFPLNDDAGSRSVSFVYQPTTSSNTLNLQLHYNNSSSPRANAIASNRGTGFTTVEGSTNAALNMSSTRSALQNANGYARAYYSGRKDEHSSGGDQHLAIAFGGTQAGGTSGDAVTIFSVNAEGVG